MERGEFPATRLYNRCHSPPAQEGGFRLSGEAGPRAVLAVVNVDYFICARAAAQQSRTLQKAAAFALTRVTPPPPHVLLADLCLFFCSPHRRECYFLFFSEKTLLKRTPAGNYLQNHMLLC